MGDDNLADYVIIGVHGLANKPEESELKDWWRKSILEGLERNEGRSANRDIAFDLCYWRDWNYPDPVPTHQNDEPYIEAEGTGRLQEYKENFWDTLREEAGDLLDTPLDWMKRSLGIEETVQAALGLKFADLALYYDNEEKRNQLRSRLEKIILKHEGSRMMVIAHSMGSIIAYDVLRRLGRTHRDLRVDHLVTIGSPLGIPHVKFKIWQESDMVRTPSIVRRWSNLSDRGDAVAADPSLAGDYGANDRRVKVHDDLVLNTYVGKAGKRNSHKSYGYLRTPELSKLIRSFI